MSISTPRPVVVVTRRLPEAVERHAAELFEARLNTTDTPLTTEQLAEAMRTADGLLPTVSDAINSAVLSVSPRRAKIVANFGVGYNNIDVATARSLGIVVTNTPGVLTDDTADLAMTLLLMAARRTGEGERHVRAGDWTGWGPTHMLGTSISGKTLGILGLGRIGRAVARRATEGFGMRVIYFDPPVPIGEARAYGASPRESIEDVLRESDFVSLHMPASQENRHLINAQRLALMPQHAILINTARGDVVDEAALAAALKSGVIRSAGLDVYEREPAVDPALLKLENVVLLPHLGSATTETRVAMGERALSNLAAFFANAPPRDRVA
jgi:lactate dehydrogenase-like 2-hydroxyacid dehydrogenase